MNTLIEQILLAYQEGNAFRFFDLLEVLRTCYVNEPHRYKASLVTCKADLAEFLVDSYVGRSEYDQLIDMTLDWLEGK